MKTSKLLLSFLVGTLFFTACSSDDTPASGNVVDHKFLNATSYTEWVYFSFEKEKIVDVTDSKNDLSWDIAFHRGDVRLNGGESGIGSGAAINTNKIQWSEVTTAPESGYVADKKGTVTTAFTGSDIETEEQPFSQTLATWLTIDTSNPPPVYAYHNWVYVVKTASGKNVKLQIYDYKNEKNAGAYISFRYQISNSTTFE